MNTESQQQIAEDHAIAALTSQNPRFGLYREQDPTFRQADVDFWSSAILSAIERATDARETTELNLRADQVGGNQQPQPQRSEQQESEVEKRITDYLVSGGLFNPEMANHDRVRDLLVDCRAALIAERQRREQAERELTITKGDWIREVIQLRNSLLSELAAIEQAIDILAAQDNVGKGRTLQEISSRNQQAIDQLRKVDLSLLHKHDAEQFRKGWEVGCKAGDEVDKIL